MRTKRCQRLHLGQKRWRENKATEGRGREPGNAISKQKHGRIINSVIVERKHPVLGRADKTEDVVKTNKTSEVAESTFNPGAKQLPSPVSPRLCGLCSPSQTDVSRGR